MIIFSVKGIVDQRDYPVILHDNGTLETDKYVEDLLVNKIEYEGEIGPPGGPHWSGSAILKNATPLYLALKQEFNDVTVVEGELPPLPEVPKRAIT